MPATMSKLASIGCFVAAGVASASSCPKDLNPYSNEANPFGWPLTPSDFDYANPTCWTEKYPRCAGERQSPMDLDLANPDASCQVADGVVGLLAGKADYHVLGGQTVTVSKYMRAASVRGDLGTLELANEHGDKVLYQATGAYLTAGSLHTVNGEEADAELLVVHKPTDAVDGLAGSVVLSMRFKLGTTDSQLFTQMGFFSGPSGAQTAPEGLSWPAPESIGLPGALDAALHGGFYSYSGSEPAPPCTENVQYLVLKEVQSVTQTQIDKLRDVVRLHAGGSSKRPTIARKALGGGCRKVLADSLVVQDQPITCPSTSNLPASCWTSCAKSPIAVTTPTAQNPSSGMDNVTSMLLYRPAQHVTVSPSTYTLDATGDFGGIIVQGRFFEARKLSIKGVASHTIDGVRHAAELVVHHTFYGERFSGPATVADHHRRLSDTSAHDDHAPAAVIHVETASDDSVDDAPAHSASPASDGDIAGEYLYEESSREVAFSIPLKIGKENALLRGLGFGDPAKRAAIASGNTYAVHEDIDLTAALLPSTSQDWFWYSGGPTEPGDCPAWGVKWLVFKQPLEVSLEQLNSVLVSVSGMDSTRMPQAATTVTKGGVPKGAVESDGWRSPEEVCDTGALQSPINVETNTVNKTGTHNFLAKASWKPITGLRLMATDGALRVETRQMGYATVMGMDGFPKYYQVTSIDLKMPSEHMVDGKQFPAELQITHLNQKTVLDLEDSDALITSFFFEFGEENKLLKQLLPAHLPDHGSYSIIKEPIDLMWALGPAMEGPYFNYAGSQTTGRCTEGAQWLVFNHTFTLSTEQWQTFKEHFPSPRSIRPVQAMNGRRLWQNLLEEGEHADLDFFLSRHGGRDRATPPVAYIAFPIAGTLSLCCVLMVAIFQREDMSRKSTSAGGLDNKPHPHASTVGKGYGRL